jgi:hypothetical protein
VFDRIRAECVCVCVIGALCSTVQGMFERMLEGVCVRWGTALEQMHEFECTFVSTIEHTGYVRMHSVK